MGNDGDIFLGQLNEMSGKYEPVTFGDKSSTRLTIDDCKAELKVSYSLTFDMTFNSTSLKCQLNSSTSDSSNDDQSNQSTYKLKVIPSKWELV